MIKLLITVLATAFTLQTVALANLGDIDEDELENPVIGLGKEELQVENWEGAIVQFEKALENTPNSADLHNFLGYAYRKLGNIEVALKHYDKALAIDPDHVGAIEYLGEAYISLGDEIKAKQQLSKLERLCSPVPCEELAELRRAINSAFK